MQFRFYFEKLGDHIHVRLFCNGLSGRLVFRENEWAIFRTLMTCGANANQNTTVEFIEESNDAGN